jgi:hypothetical protein
MGQRVYVLSQSEYSNILGIFTNIRQCRKFIETLTNKENIILHEIRLNEPERAKVNMTKLLTLKESDRINQEKQKLEKDQSLSIPIYSIVKLLSDSKIETNLKKGMLGTVIELCDNDIYQVEFKINEFNYINTSIERKDLQINLIFDKENIKK